MRSAMRTRRRVVVDHRRWVGTTGSRIHPQSALLGLASARVENRHRRVVGVDLVGAQDLARHALDKRREQGCAACHPTAQSRSRDIDILAGDDLRLAIQRQVVGVFADQHMGKQPWTGQALIDGLRGQFGGEHRLAVPTSVLGSNESAYEERRRAVVELLGDLLADGMQHTPALIAGVVVDIQALVLARQMRRRGFAYRAPALGLRLLGRLRRRGFVGGGILVERIEPQTQLLLGHLLGLAPEVLARQPRELALELGFLRALGIECVEQITHHPVQ